MCSPRISDPKPGKISGVCDHGGGAGKKKKCGGGGGIGDGGGITIEMWRL